MTRTLILALSLFSSALLAQNKMAAPRPLGSGSDISFKNELKIAIDRGIASLQAQQNSNGWFATSDHPAMTALATTAILGRPGEPSAQERQMLTNAFKFLVANVQSDGGIYKKDLPNYNTAISLVAFATSHNQEYLPIIQKARQWLISHQQDLGEKGKLDNDLDGSFGYGDGRPSGDLNNTFEALEALYYSRDFKSKDVANTKDLNWEAAIHFIQICQNVKGNTQPWVSADPADQGGFIYAPGQSKAGGETNAAGKVSLRSYGSISYAGLLSYIYADMKRDDPRITAAVDYLNSHYTVDENPAMGQAGYYYYLHLMTKALTLNGLKEETSDGKKVDWRYQTAMKLLNLQQQNGGWKNSVNRWLEADPVLVTAYSLMALEMIHNQL